MLSHVGHTMFWGTSVKSTVHWNESTTLPFHLFISSVHWFLIMFHYFESENLPKNRTTKAIQFIRCQVQCWRNKIHTLFLIFVSIPLAITESQVATILCFWGIFCMYCDNSKLIIWWKPGFCTHLKQVLWTKRERKSERVREKINSTKKVSCKTFRHNYSQIAIYKEKAIIK